MSQTIAVTGMVLSAMPVNEYDKRIVLLTKERGRITVFAKGARRQNSPFMGGTRPFVFGNFELYEGRTSYTVKQIGITNYFMKLSSDYELTCYGFYFCEYISYFTREYSDESEMLKLLYQSFRALEKENLPNELVRFVLELKAFALNGDAPCMFECVMCGLSCAKQEEYLFCAERRGIVCKECRKKKTGEKFLHLSASALYTIQYVIASPVEKLYTFLVSEKVLKELKNWMDIYRKICIDRKFKALEILETTVG